jgi:hypothetical protein
LEFGNIISNSYHEKRWTRRTSRIVRGFDMPLVSNNGIKMLFNVVLGVNGWNASEIDRTTENKPVD